MKNEKYEIRFPDYYDDLYEFECESKGYINDIEVYLNNGNCYSLCFMVPVRIDQDLQSEIEMGNIFLYETNLIVIQKVTKENIILTIGQIFEEGVFKSMKQLN